MSRMKKLVASALGLMMITSMMPTTVLANQTIEVGINQENFPDENFRECVKQFDVDKSDTLSLEECNAVEVLVCDGLFTPKEKKIKDLKGVEFFKELTELHAYGNKLTTLELDNPKLTHVLCFHNELTTLKVKSENVEIVDCADNHLTSLDIASKKLVSLACDNNDLTTLDISKYPNLNALSAVCNYITDIDTSANPLLEEIYYAPKEIKMDVREGFDYTKVPTFDEFSEMFFKYEGYYADDLTVDADKKTVSLNADVDSAILSLQLDGSESYDFTFYYEEEKPEVKPEVKPETKPTEKPTTKPTDPKQEVVKDEKTPQTSDTSRMGMYSVMLLLAFVTGFSTYKKKEAK